MTSSTGTSGLMPRRIPTQRRKGGAHGGQVHDGRHAGEVLHEHPLGGQGDLACLAPRRAVALRLPSPRGDRLDVVRGDLLPVFVAQEVLE